MGGSRGQGSHFYNDYGSRARVRCSSSNVISPPSVCCFQRVQPEANKTVFARLDSEGSCEGNSQTSAALLFSSFRCCKGRGQSASYNRFVHSEQISGRPIIQDGNSIKNSFEHSRAPVGVQDRSQGRLFSRPSKLAISAVSGFHDGRSDICFSVSPVRSCSSSVGLHKDYQTCEGFPTQGGSQDLLLSGRLPSLGRVSRGVKQDLSFSSGSLQKTRFFNKQREVNNDSKSESRVFRGTFPSKVSAASSASGESCKGVSSVQGDVSEVSRLQETIRESTRGPELCLVPGPSGEVALITTDSLDEQEHIHRDKRQVSGYRSNLQGGPGDLAEREVSEYPSSYVCSDSISSANDRRFESRLGGGFTSLQGLGGLASGVPFLLNEPAGNASYFSFPGAFLLHSPREPSSDYVRQYDSSFVHQEPGNTEVTSPVRDLKESSGILRGILHNSSPQAPSREVECVGRPGVPSGSNFYRMVSRPGDLQGDLEQAWAFCLRSVCQQIQHTVREFPVSLSRSSGPGHQRPFDFMGPVGLNLSISSSSFAPRGGSSSIIVPRERSSHSSLIPSFGMVSEPSSSFQRALPPPSLNVSFPGDNQRQGFPPEPFYLAASRVETIILGLMRHGFSRHVSERLVGACRDSTLKTYQSAWKNFLDFLTVQGIVHSLVSIPVVCEFLDYFCTSMEREYRTLGVYKCALRLPLLWACDLDIEGVLMQNYMRGVFNYRRPQKTKEMPRWSLNRLLEFLKGNLFEPLETISDSRLTQKALFLILLASGRRKSEIFNISRNSRVLSDSSLELTWVRGFTPKHHTPDFQPSCPSISRLISRRVSDKFLCPVRAYKAYLERTQFWLDRNPGTLLPEVLWLFPWSTHKASADYLSELFGILVGESRLRGEPREEVGIHQIRKLAASHAMCEGQDEEVVKSKMGFSEVRIFRKNYVAPVSKLKVACVLPGGTCIPNRTHELSDSDSD